MATFRRFFRQIARAGFVFLDGIGGKGVIRGCGGKKGDGGKGNRVVTVTLRYVTIVTVT